MSTSMEKIYAVLPLRPAVVRELIEELQDVDRPIARNILRVEIEQGRMALGWDGRIHRRDA